MRSAANVASASSIATAGSLSPVSPAASTPSSSSRSTVSSCAASASSIASSESETQNATLGLVGGRRDDEHLGALDLVAEHGAQQVGVDGLGRQDEQLHVEAATPGWSATNGAAQLGRDAQHQHGDVVAHRAALHVEHGVLDVTARWRSAPARGTR